MLPSYVGLLIAAVCVIAAYYSGFRAGFSAGRNDGFDDGKREGAREGSIRAYAVGFDRGRRRSGHADEDGHPPRTAKIAGLAGIVLAVAVLWMLARQPSTTPSMPPPSIDSMTPQPTLTTTTDLSID